MLHFKTRIMTSYFLKKLTIILVFLFSLSQIFSHLLHIISPPLKRIENHQFSATYFSDQYFKHNFGISNYFYGKYSVMITPLNLEEMKKGDIIFSKNHYVLNFFENQMPKAHKPFILVSLGDSSVPSEINSKNTKLQEKQKNIIRKALANPNLIHWFTTNYDQTIKHPKISGIPLGLDYTPPKDSSIYKPYIPDLLNLLTRPFTGKQLNLFEDDKLVEITSSMPKTDKRIPKVYLDGGMSYTDTRWKNGYGFMDKKYESIQYVTRKQIIEYFKNKEFIFYQQNKIPRIEQWQKRTQYAFSISPNGNGIDCYRLWESLALGQIVIVQTSPLDYLYEGLPVVIVKDWSEVNPENLEKWLVQYADAAENPKYREKLKFKYWYEKINSLRNLEHEDEQVGT